MKKIIALIICLILSIGVVIGLSYLEEEKMYIKGNTFENSLVSQEILSYTSDVNVYYKIYQGNQLIGVLSDSDVVADELNNEYEKYKDLLPNSKMLLDSSIYICKEAGNMVFEDADDKIIAYLRENDLFGFEAYIINISLNEEILDTIYVSSIEEFKEARDKFILNFVDEEVLECAKTNTKIEGISEFGSKDVGVYLENKFEYHSVIISADEIFKNEDEIYEYFCYGRNEKREYYTIKEGDTLDYVGYSHGFLTADQIYKLNKDVLSSKNQILAPGTVLNVTYFSSPINVVVSKQRRIQERITPPTPTYITKYSMENGAVYINKKEVTGLKNVIYEEKWINGVYYSDSILSSEIIRQPEKGEIWLGLGAQYATGSGEFIWPIDYPYMTYGFMSYVDIYGNNHEGIDIINLRDRGGPVYAADTGTVAYVGYDPLMNGNWVMINHNNGYQTIYGHMRDWPMVEEGQAVNKGDQLGWIGSTGLSSGRHLHWGVYINWKTINPCNVMNCAEIE